MKKRKIIEITITSIILITLSIILVKYSYKKNKINITLTKKDIDVYEDIELKDIINEDINLLNNKKIDTNHIGEHELEVKYKNKIFKYKEKIKVNIIDTIAPVILIKNKVVEQNTNLDLVNSYLCADNYDARPNCYIEGTYNFDEIGTYNLKYIAVDSSNNKTEKNFKLTVKPKEKNNKKQEESYIAYEDIVKKHKTENTKIGIDISKWQGEVDFKKLKENNVEFIYIKLGGSHIDKDIYIDPYFIKNINGAKEFNIPVGIYFYSNASSVEDIKNEINFIKENIKDYKIDLGVTFDWENFTDFNSYNISLHTLNEMAEIFMTEFKNNNYDPMLYSSEYYLNNIWDIKDNVWIAKYADKNTYEGPYKIWQLCSDGKIDGINGYVDIDVMYE